MLEQCRAHVAGCESGALALRLVEVAEQQFDTADRVAAEGLLDRVGVAAAGCDEGVAVAAGAGLADLGRRWAPPSRAAGPHPAGAPGPPGAPAGRPPNTGAEFPPGRHWRAGAGGPGPRRTGGRSGAIAKGFLLSGVPGSGTLPLAMARSI